MQPTVSKVPKHVGVILDGNRRFAKRLMLKPWKGHEWGAEKINQLLEWAGDMGIQELTLYAFSSENFDRPTKEFNYLMDLFAKEFTKLKSDERVDKNEIRINFIGRIHLFPKKVYTVMQEIMEKTKKYNKRIVNFAMAYGGRAEIIDAAKKIAQQVKEGKLNIDQINEETFPKNLYTDHEPALIIRTGGEHRTSNFLNYQAAYAEWIYVEKMWPEFTKKDFEECIAEYQARGRRFGR